MNNSEKYLISIDSNDNMNIIQLGPNSSLMDMVRILLNCDYLERVSPRNLPQPYCFLCDEDFYSKNLPVNTYGSYLYGGPIQGTIVIAKIYAGPEGYDIFPLSIQETALMSMKIEGELNGR
jgi:hypothetical protein